MRIDHAAHGPARRAGITAVAYCLPEREVTSRQLRDRIAAASVVSLPDRLFERATDIVSRRAVADGEYASTLAVRAARDALERAGLAPYDVGLLVFASASRDVVEPATAHIVQAELGSRAHALDVTNACDSFVNGIDTARAMILAGRGPPGPGRHRGDPQPRGAARPVRPRPAPGRVRRLHLRRRAGRGGARWRRWSGAASST